LDVRRGGIIYLKLGKDQTKEGNSGEDVKLHKFMRWSTRPSIVIISKVDTHNVHSKPQKENISL
jgi:hypothetical protein